MSCCDKQEDFCVGLGETFVATFRWETPQITSTPITAISKAAPAVVTATANGMVDGWRAAVVSALGMTEINATRYPPEGRDWHKGTVLTANTVQFNSLNSGDFSAYTSGGFLVYYTPQSLASASAVMTIRDAPTTGNVLLTLTSSPLAGIVLDDTAKTIVVTFATAALAWVSGFYALDLTDSTGKITQLSTGAITIK